METGSLEERDIKLEVNIVFFIFTVSDNFELCPKLQFSEKLQNCEFEFLSKKTLIF